MKPPTPPVAAAPPRKKRAAVPGKTKRAAVPKKQRRRSLSSPTTGDTGGHTWFYCPVCRGVRFRTQPDYDAHARIVHGE